MFWQQDGCEIHLGDCLDVLKQMEEDSVHVCVTSPPYFALRSYLPKDHPDKDKEIGSEPTPEAFIQTMVAVFREVRRVLRPDGVCWVNLGDGYAGTGKTDVVGDAGNLLNTPHRVAEALRQDGWIWRQTIVWAKKSPMPESVGGWRWQRCRVKVDGERVPGTFRDGSPYVNHAADGEWNDTASRGDGSTAKWAPCPGCPKCLPNNGYVLRRGAGRCTTAHEYLFLMTKTNRYFWDSEASKEECLPDSAKRATYGYKPCKTDEQNHYGEGFQRGPKYTMTSRNPRSVWTLSSEPTKVRHFATFPSELVMRALASAPTKVCPACGAPWAPVVESERVATRPALNPKAFDAWKHTEADGNGQRSAASPNLDPERHIAITSCSGYRQTCSCPPHQPKGGLCLDPFAGIGTTGQTARHLGMKFIGIDLNEEYLQHATKRIMQKPRWWLRKQKAVKKPVEPLSEQGVLFT